VETETRFCFQFLWKRKPVSDSILSSYKRIAVETETRFRFCNGNMFWFPFCHLIYGAVPHLCVFRVATEP
jgi:hypothetical protein